ncbi:MAG TPA: hypothetical protein VFQ22_13650, partial [Longimicrobiales bacterium]|nr:hypothetical protein [Longimicrobiales bacterium]
MSGRPYLIFAALLLALGATRGVERPGRPVPLPPPGAFAPSDSALEELEASRFWHAARMMRSEGLADGGPADVLLLARAEAGWENWPAVLELLEDAPWIEAEDGGSGLRLLGRAYEAEGRWADAARMLGRYAERAPAPDAEIAPALSRRARALWRAGEHAEALRVLGALLAVPEVRSWTVYELLVLAAAEGDTAGVRGLLAHAVEPGARDAAWSAEADALLAAGDTARAAAAFAALREAYDGSRRAQMALELGRLRLAAGDGAARELLLEAYRLGRGTTESEAAEALLDLGGFDAELTLGLARTVDRAGDGARALRAYDQVARAAAGGAAGLPEWARLERARLMSTVRERQDEALEEFRAIREATADPRIGARNLDAWRRMRDRQGMAAQVATLRRWLIEDYPESPEAIELMWSEGSSAEDRGALDLAHERYAFIAEHAPTSSRAGEA